MRNGGRDGGWPLKTLQGILNHQSAASGVHDRCFVEAPTEIMPFDIRRYTPGDLAGLIVLFRDTVRRINRRDYSQAQVMAWAPDEIDAQQWARRFGNKAVWVADLEGAPVGFVDVARDGQIDMLYVHADHQGRGIASRLLGTVEAGARAHGLLRLFTEASITARPFFERRGFRVLAPQRVVRWAQEFVNYRMDKQIG
jgi:putative acetyltransferase